MIWETQRAGAVTELGETSARPPRERIRRPGNGRPPVARQEPPAPAAPPPLAPLFRPPARNRPSRQAQNQPAGAPREEHATFTSRVNLVMVPVVVRDKQGNVG